MNKNSSIYIAGHRGLVGSAQSLLGPMDLWEPDGAGLLESVMVPSSTHPDHPGAGLAPSAFGGSLVEVGRRRSLAGTRRDLRDLDPGAQHPRLPQPRHGRSGNLGRSPWSESAANELPVGGATER